MAQGLSGPLSSLDNLLDGHMMSLLSLDLSANRFAGQPRLSSPFCQRADQSCLRMLQRLPLLVPSAACPGAYLDVLWLGGMRCTLPLL